MSDFSLQHVVLYAKRWYLNSGDLYADLKKVISADGYGGEFFTDNDCATLILARFEELNYKEYRSSITSFIIAIQPSECWKMGYEFKVTNDERTHHLPEYNIFEASIRYCLSVFALLSNKEWKACRPDFNVLPMGRNVTETKVDEMFGKLPETNKDIVEKTFGLGADFYKEFFGGLKK